MGDDGSPLTVLHLRSSPFLGSPERMLLGQIRALHGGVCEYVVGVIDEQEGRGNDFADRVCRSGAAAFTLPGAGLLLPLALSHVVAAVGAHGVDVICTHDYKANLLGVVAGRLRRVPVVAVHHGRTSHDWKVRLYEALDRRVLARCARVVAVSEPTRRTLEAQGIRRERLQVIPNAVDTAATGPGEAAPVRTALGLAPAVPVILYAGRLSAEKGLHVLLGAMRLVVEAVPETTLLILGQGPEEPRLRVQAHGAGLDGRVRFLGFQQDVQSFLRDSDLVVLPSFREGMPVSLLEALAVGKPVVATRVGGVPEIVEHDVTGLLVEPGDETGLASAVVTLLRDRSRGRRMGEAGARRVRERYTFDRQAKDYVTLFREVSGLCRPSAH